MDICAYHKWSKRFLHLYRRKSKSKISRLCQRHEKIHKTLTISCEIRIINQTVRKLSIFLEKLREFLNCIDVGNDNLYTVYSQLFCGGIQLI